MTLLEKRDKPGGRAYVYEQDGFTFDGGPTIITAPWLIRDLFERCGRRTEDYVTLVPIDPFYNIRFEDGSVFHYNGDREKVLAEVRKFNPADEAGYLKFFVATEKIYKTGFDLIDQPFTHFADMVRVIPDHGEASVLQIGCTRSSINTSRTSVCDRSLAFTRY
ncbi:MAG: FAD-dependent oxidoreductase [Pyrinomonadaceae bacterium]